jgi:hypothetical protein
MKKIPMGDVWGGLSASALVLPQAMAFGISLYQLHIFSIMKMSPNNRITCVICKAFMMIAYNLRLGVEF